ncbi:MAG: tetratricopeptide repeat protein [Candidatus Acidiferrales bacterium]
MTAKMPRRFTILVLLTAGAFSGVGLAQEPVAPAPAPGQDAYLAQKDIEVGTFYMHKGDIDAAIDRFQDAIKNKPNFAKPRLLLAEAYEKKGEKSEVLKYYKEYLQVFPQAPDAKRIQKKIEKLNKELAKNSGDPR